MEELHTNVTVQPGAAPEPLIPQKSPVPLRDRVLAFVAGFLGLVLRVVKNVIEEAVALKAENDFTI